MQVKLTSDITIGNFRFSGVHELRIKRSLRSYVDTASLQIPSIARIVRKDGKADPKDIITGKQFNDGDKAVISIGYDGVNEVEFEGFVKRRNFNMPLEIELEGYSYQLRRNSVSGFWKSISIKSLLQKAIADTDITLQCDVDMDMTNIRITDGCGADLLDAIIKASNQTLAIFFIKPKVLYCGLLYTAYTKGEDLLKMGESKYRLGFNCPMDNNLRQRVLSNDPVEVHFLKKTAQGKRISGKSTRVRELAKRLHRKVLNNIGSEADLQRLADEKEFKLNYEGYEGRLTGFLWPVTQVGYVVFVKNTLFPERDGYYLADAIEITFGVSGGRRYVDIQHKVGAI